MFWKSFKNATLLQLVEEYKKKSDVSANMYYI